MKNPTRRHQRPPAGEGLTQGERSASVAIQVLGGGILAFIFLWIIWLA
jgi:hypothetical protein